jgi:3-O-methylgallate 3,4-dioxygenase
MARIILGLGSSHSPQLSTTTDWWEDHANRDRRNPFLVGRDGEVHNYDELAAVPEWNVPADRLTPDVWAALYGRAQQSIETLGQALAEAAPDVVVVLGDDQNEIFLNDGMPTFAVYWGDTISDMPPSDEKRRTMPAGLREAIWAAHSDTGEDYKVPGALGEHVIEQLVLDEFDVVAFSQQPEQRSLGHAFTFVRRRLMSGAQIPLLPVMINAYNPPNQPSPRRCFNFGRAVRRAIETYPDDITVAVVASGGLSHFVVDEALDQRIIRGLRDKDADALTTVERKYMRSGSSETLNWIAAGGALENLAFELVDYIPAYRSPAGTGVGMTFAVWR